FDIIVTQRYDNIKPLSRRSVYLINQVPEYLTFEKNLCFRFRAILEAEHQPAVRHNRDLLARPCL
ncbi:MAG TPA: hypothetical protein VN374_08430, partial [Desulfitobacteriaceae bacterium]|nr:hypothetical protein [Desulfitobacteriaceae bacterium]